MCVALGTADQVFPRLANEECWCLRHMETSTPLESSLRQKANGRRQLFDGVLTKIQSLQLQHLADVGRNSPDAIRLSEGTRWSERESAADRVEGLKCVLHAATLERLICYPGRRFRVAPHAA